MITRDPLTSMGLPPPPHSLVDLDRVVGWTHGTTVGFTGFADEREARKAAWLAHRTIARRLTRGSGLPIPFEARSLEVERRDGRDVIVADGEPIATLLRPAVGSLAGTDWHAIEVEVPAPVDHVRVRALAYLAYRSLRRSGIAWSMLDHSIEPEPMLAEVEALAGSAHSTSEAHESWWGREKLELAARRIAEGVSAIGYGRERFANRIEPIRRDRGAPVPRESTRPFTPVFMTAVLVAGLLVVLLVTLIGRVVGPLRDSEAIVTVVMAMVTLFVVARSQHPDSDVGVDSPG
jgi:hypothetical protein